MERKLRKLFDYQRFYKNKDLDRLIRNSLEKYEDQEAFEMSDNSLLLVAGGKKDVEEDRKNVTSSNKDLELWVTNFYSKTFMKNIV